MPSRLRCSGIAFLFLAGTCVAGCTNTSGNARARETGLTVGSSGWYSGAAGADETEIPPPTPRRSDGNRSLRPNEPWLGQLGFRQALSLDSELGLGIAAPNSLLGTEQSAASLDRGHDLGVGLWWKLDF